MNTSNMLVILLTRLLNRWKSYAARALHYSQTTPHIREMCDNNKWWHHNIGLRINT